MMMMMMMMNIVIISHSQTLKVTTAALVATHEKLFLLKASGENSGKVSDEFLDVVYWFRQIIAVVLGVIWGVAPLKGFLGIAIFCVINAGVLYVYISSFQQVDEEEYGGTWELTKEGFMTSFALFLVVWIIFFTALHYD
uniref:RAB5 interacting factor n=1 Tax=Cyprinus carpio carpio TaxID=630221 RepID=A0A9J8AA49_CYPCA